MPKQTWSQPITTQADAGASYATFTTAKTVINQACLVDHPRNYWTTGRKMRVTVCGAISNIVTTPGTIVFQIMFGSIIVWTSGNVQLNATAHTTLPFKLQVELTCQLANSTVGGAIAKLMGLGTLTGVMFTKTAGQTDGANTETVMMVPVTAPALGTAFDGTIAQTQDFWVGFSISNAANLIRIDQYEVELTD